MPKYLVTVRQRDVSVYTKVFEAADEDEAMDKADEEDVDCDMGWTWLRDEGYTDSNPEDAVEVE